MRTCSSKFTQVSLCLAAAVILLLVFAYPYTPISARLPNTYQVKLSAIHPQSTSSPVDGAPDSVQDVKSQQLFDSRPGETFAASLTNDRQMPTTVSQCCKLTSPTSSIDFSRCDWFCPVGIVPSTYFSSKPRSPLIQFPVVCLKGVQKSGTTWLEYITRYLLENLCEELQEDRRCRLVSLASRQYLMELWGDKPRSLFLSPYDSDKSPGCFKHNPPNYQLSNIIMIRDPRDTAASAVFYNHPELNSSRIMNSLNEEERMQAFAPFASEWLAAVQKATSYTRRVLEELKQRHASPTLPPQLVLKYESMRVDPASALDSIVDFLDLSPVSDNTLEHVLAATSFLQLKSVEARGEMKQFGGKGDKVHKGHGEKVREGKIAGYEKLVSPHIVEEANKFIETASEDVFQLYVARRQREKFSKQQTIASSNSPSKNSKSSSNSNPAKSAKAETPPSQIGSNKLLSCLRGHLNADGSPVLEKDGSKRKPINFLHIMSDDQHFRAAPWSIWGQTIEQQQREMAKQGESFEEDASPTSNKRRRSSAPPPSFSGAPSTAYAAGLRMPVLSSLAARGITFENAHVAVPMCSQSRHALMSGIPFHSLYSGREDKLKQPTPHRQGGGKSSDFHWLGRQLKQHFKVGMTGKVDGFPIDEAMPTYRHIFEGGMHDYGSIPVRSSTNPLQRSSIRRSPTEVFTDAAVHLLKNELQYQEEDGRPFALFVHYTAPHDPRVPNPSNFKEDYLSNRTNCPLMPNFAKYPKFDPGTVNHIRQEMMYPRPLNERQWQEETAGYFGLLTQMDASIGRIIDQLREDGRLDSTMIIFQSDNGLMMGSHGLVAKQVMYEESIRVPMFVTGACVNPSKSIAVDSEVKNPLRSHALVYLHEVHHTLLEWAGITLTSRQSIAGQSFLPVIEQALQDQRDEQTLVVTRSPDIDSTKQQFTPHSHLFFSYGHSRLSPAHWFEAIKSEDGYKLLVYPFISDEKVSASTTSKPFEPFRPISNPSLTTLGRVELFDLLSDPMELYDLSKDPSLEEVRDELKRQLLEMRKRLTNG